MVKKILSLICAAAVSLSLLPAAGCADGTPAAGDGTTQEPEETVPQTEIVIGRAGVSEFSVITPEGGQYGEGAMGVQLYMKLDSTRYRGLKYNDDYLVPGTAEDPDACEIVIGATNRAISSSLAGKLGAPRDYIIAVEGNKIGIYSESADGIRRAVEDVMSRLSEKDGVLTLTVPEFLCVQFVYPAANMKIGGRPLSDYSVVIPDRSAQNAALASRINAWVLDKAGFELPVKTPEDPASECEILLGNTGRPESVVYYSGPGALGRNEYALSLSGTKLSAAYPSYSTSAVKALMKKLEPAADLSDFTERFSDDAYAIFRNDNYAEGRLPAGMLDAANPGVLAELSCLMYYEDCLLSGIAKGEKWVYTNSSTYGVCGVFADMLPKSIKGANCAMPQGWMFIDIGVIKSGHMFGSSKGSVYGLDTHGVYAQCVADFTYWEGKYTFDQLFRRGHVKPGDIFFATGHTFVYIGDDKFFAAGHDAKWHSDPDAYTEDSRKAVFDDWVVSRFECHDNSYIVNYQLRFKDEFIPHYYRNAKGEITLNPMWSEEESIEFKPGVSSKKVIVPLGEF